MIPVSDADLDRAAELIRQGRLVAFPTETVYGLGANALSAAAVERIYEAKGRPATSPLIVHVYSVELARQLATDWGSKASALTKRFWPGPLTLVVPKHPALPDNVTAGLGTVGLRMPAHPVARALLQRAGVPIAAPSANRFTQLSPTTAEHVRRSLGDRVDMILDGGPTEVGIESTVLSLAGPPVVLRPGMISRSDIEAVIGPVDLAGDPEPGPHLSPGQHRRHYSPRTRLVLLPVRGFGIYGRTGGRGRAVQMPTDPEQYAARLYAVLHDLDEDGWEVISVESPPDTVEWAGVRDRLQRASAQE